MKKKLAVLLVAAMTLSVAGTAFAHQVIVNDPTEKAAAAEEEKKEEVAETAEAPAEEVKEEVKEAEAPAAEAEAPAEEAAVEDANDETVVVTSPNKESDRTVITEEGTSSTYRKPKEPKTIYNTAPSAEHPFIDVTGANEDYARAAYALGMTLGMTKEAKFIPDGTLSTEDAVTFLYRLEGAEGKNGNIIAKISEANGYAQKPLTWAAGLGLVEKSVEPKSEITVAQLKTMIDKLGYTTSLVGTENTMTRIDGLKIILDSIVGDLDKIDTEAVKAWI